ncbi:MAG: DPP IV N-terminal domain-containing protein [Bacteroidales bacterium]|nr:DPP IV N-terminal domain-containing protein [Acholeplasmataceae bacterium]MCK9449899.1 DPP IV N-terminal domain-containing protein [Bacteroidales bacterium]
MKHTPFYLITTVLMLIFYSCNKNTDRLIKPVDFNITDSEPAWSPDGQWIAFVHGSMPNDGIYLIRPDGTGNRLWHKGVIESPTWSPCGQWIAFSQNAQIWKKKIDGDSLTQLTFEGRNFFPSWSSCGQWIAYDAFIDGVNRNFYAIWKIERTGAERVLIGFSDVDGDYRMPHWIGNTIVHIRYIRVGYAEIFTMDSEGNNVKRLTYDGKRDEQPKLSADGLRIVYNSQDPNIPYHYIWTMNADGSNPKQITFFSSYGCDWSPCGNYIVYTDVRAENGRLWIMNADGSGKRQLTFEHHFLSE